MPTEAQKKATATYKKRHYKRVPLDIQNDEYAMIKAYAEAHGETVNGMIKRLVRQEMDKNKTENET